MRDLKQVYRATSKEVAEDGLLDLEVKWGGKYPVVIESWQRNWEQLSQYFQYTEPIRKIIYTTNAVEGFHRQVQGDQDQRERSQMTWHCSNWYIWPQRTSKRSGRAHCTIGALPFNNFTLNLGNVSIWTSIGAHRYVALTLGRIPKPAKYKI